MIIVSCGTIFLFEDSLLLYIGLKSLSKGKLLGSLYKNRHRGTSDMSLCGEGII
jgi:hypothetical protein